jgi:hypothetical protein
MAFFSQMQTHGAYHDTKEIWNLKNVWRGSHLRAVFGFMCAESASLQVP